MTSLESAAFQFTQATYVTSESSGTALITVSRSLTSASASVTCATVTGGTAQPGTDYIPVTTTLDLRSRCQYPDIHGSDP